MGGRITLIQRFCGLWRHPMDFKWHYNKKKNAMRMYSRSIVVWGILTNLESNFTLPLIPKCPLIHKLTKHTLMIYIKWASFWYFRYCNIVMQSFVQMFSCRTPHAICCKDQADWEPASNRMSWGNSPVGILHPVQICWSGLKCCWQKMQYRNKCSHADMKINAQIATTTTVWSPINILFTTLHNLS